jgi:hypothetical protein
MASNETEPRVVRKDDLIAEAFEEEAARMPPSFNKEAEAFREAAKRLRASDSRCIVKVWET